MSVPGMEKVIEEKRQKREDSLCCTVQSSKWLVSNVLEWCGADRAVKQPVKQQSYNLQQLPHCLSVRI